MTVTVKPALVRGPLTAVPAHRCSGIRWCSAVREIPAYREGPEKFSREPEHTDRGPAEGRVAVSWLAMPRCGLRAQLGDDRQDGAGHRTGAARADLCDQASCGPHVRAWCATRYAKSGGRFHPCRPGFEPRRCDVGRRDDKHWGSFNEAFSKVATRRAISARSRIPRKNLCQAGLALSRAEGQSQR